MQVHQLQSTSKNKKKKRIGRGGKRGTYSGKGMKGQKARAGRKMRPEIRDIIKKIPKKRGYRFASPRGKSAIVTLRVLEKAYEDGDTISRQTLSAKRLIQSSTEKSLDIKVVGSYPLKKKFIVSNLSVSKGARMVIEKAGGKINQLR